MFLSVCSCYPLRGNIVNPLVLMFLSVCSGYPLRVKWVNQLVMFLSVAAAIHCGGTTFWAWCTIPRGDMRCWMPRITASPTRYTLKARKAQKGLIRHFVHRGGEVHYIGLSGSVLPVSNRNGMVWFLFNTVHSVYCLPE
jgi:hypothetical protein